MSASVIQVSKCDHREYSCRHLHQASDGHTDFLDTLVLIPTLSSYVVQVSIVSQEPVLFAESIMHNIAFGMPGGSGSVSLAMVRVSRIMLLLHSVPCLSSKFSRLPDNFASSQPVTAALLTAFLVAGSPMPQTEVCGI